jgi:hypothetical protein
MKDYQQQLDTFTEHADKKTIEFYLEKYWLDKDELNTIWLPIKNKIYNERFNYLPDPVFNAHFDIITLLGGSLLTKQELGQLQSCMKITGDKYLIILEVFDENNPPHTSGPPFRFKFPADITWETIISGAELSLIVFQLPERNWFVFGDSGKWGKYKANDYEYPLDITGFDEKYSDLFKSSFNNPGEDVVELKNWLKYYGLKPSEIDKYTSY